jgi:hypothetical protein
MAGHFSAKAKRSTSRPLAGSLNAIGLGVIVTDVELRQCELSLKDDEATARASSISVRFAIGVAANEARWIERIKNRRDHEAQCRTNPALAIEAGSGRGRFFG